MNKSILFSAFFLTSTLCADGDIVAAVQPQQMNNNNMMSINTLTSARTESKYGWYLFADVLYWHADVGNTDWATKFQNGALGRVTNDSVHHLDFKWSWGFKVGIGANIDHDMWDTNFYYTWFQTDNSNQAALPSSVGVVVDNNTGSSYQSGKTHWNIRFNMFDWEVGRWNYLSKKLALRPHVGIKGGWINQSIRQSFSRTNLNVAERFHNNFWGVGPSAGLNTLWVLVSAGQSMDHRFSLFGDFAGALMYGHFQVKNRQVNKDDLGTVLPASVNYKNLTRNLAATMLQGVFGFSWDTSFNQDRNHFMMKVGYELQYWFRQNQLFSVYDLNRFSDDLALQGVTAEFRFDF